MPARTKRRLHSRVNGSKVKHPQKSSPQKWKYWILIFVVISISILIKVLLFSSKYWEDNGKLSVAVHDRNGDVSVYVIDNHSEEITRIILPGNMEVEVANGLGVWKLKSVWELGKNEKKEGELLAKTINRYFKFPVYTWADSGFQDVIAGNAVKSFFGVLTPIRSNLTYGDLFKAIFFSLRVKNVSREEIDLSKSTFLKKTTLRDGGEGYQLSGFDYPRMYAEFSDYGFLEKTVRVMIKDATGTADRSKSAGRILEVMGAKVSSIVREKEEELGCEVTGPESMKNQIRITSFVLGCVSKESLQEGNFDLIVKLGNKYL